MTPRAGFFHRVASPVGAVVLVSLVFLITFALIEKRGFWIIDNQIKFLQLQGIIASNYQDFSLRWPGQEIDPELTYQPMVFPFYTEQDGKLYAAYSPVLPTVTTIFFKAFGRVGLYLLPLLCSILVLVGLAKLADAMEMSTIGRSAAVLIAGLCSPVWFYSVVYWEHNIALCFCIWGVLFLARFIKGSVGKHLILASLLLVLGIYFRDELYVFWFAAALVTLYLSPGRRLSVVGIMGATMAVSIVPLWVFQWRAIGQPFGFHLGQHLFSLAGLSQHLADRGRVLYLLFGRVTPVTWLSLLLVAPYVLTFLAYPRLSRRTFNAALPLYCVVAAVSFFFIMRGYFTSSSPIYWMLRSNSLFAASPILMLAFMRLKNTSVAAGKVTLPGFLWLLCLAYVVVYGLLSPFAATEGIHWGNRLLLVLYPLFAVLAAGNLGEWLAPGHARPRWGVVVLALTLLMSLAAQGYSLTLLHQKKQFNYRLNQFLRTRSEEAIITDSWWVPMELYSEFYNKPIFRVRTEEQLNRLLATLDGAGYGASLYATRASNVTGGTGFEEVRDDLDYFSIRFVPMRHNRE